MMLAEMSSEEITEWQCYFHLKKKRDDDESESKEKFSKAKEAARKGGFDK